MLNCELRLSDRMTSWFGRCDFSARARACVLRAPPTTSVPCSVVSCNNTQHHHIRLNVWLGVGRPGLRHVGQKDRHVCGDASRLHTHPHAPLTHPHAPSRTPHGTLTHSHGILTDLSCTLTQLSRIFHGTSHAPSRTFHVPRTGLSRARTSHALSPTFTHATRQARLRAPPRSASGPSRVTRDTSHAPLTHSHALSRIRSRASHSRTLRMRPSRTPLTQPPSRTPLTHQLLLGV